jgi:hypothetical protein
VSFIRTGIARGGDEQDPRVHVGLDGIVKGLRKSPTAPGVVGSDDIIRGIAGLLQIENILQAAYSPRSRPRPKVAQELAMADLDAPVDAHDAHVVIAYSSDRAADVGAVPIAIEWVRIVVVRIYAVDVIYVAVAVIVYAVARDFSRISPEIRIEIRVIVVNASVNDEDDDAGASGGDVPGFWGINVSVGGTAGLSGVVQPPQLGEVGVIGSQLHVLGFAHNVVGLGIEHVCIALISGDGLRHAQVRRDFYQIEIGDNLKALQHLSPDGSVDLINSCLWDIGRKSDQELIFDILIWDGLFLPNCDHPPKHRTMRSTPARALLARRMGDLLVLPSLALPSEGRRAG